MSTSDFPAREAQRLRVSFEFSPPRTEAAERTLWETITRLAPLQPTFFCRVDFMNRRGIFSSPQAEFTAYAGCSFKPLLSKGVPLIAVGTFAQPLGRSIAAALTGIKCFGFGHLSSIQ